jgi:hypothetical protein
MLGNGLVRQGFDAAAIDRVGEAIVAGEDGGLRRLQVFNLIEDQQASVVKRALAMRGEVIKKAVVVASPICQDVPEKSRQDQEILRDILAVSEPNAVLIQTEPLAALLRESAGDYQKLTSNELRTRLRELGIHSRQVNRRVNGQQDNKRGIVLEDVRAALGSVAA